MRSLSSLSPLCARSASDLSRARTDDAFCIGQEAGFGTINGLRLGRLPGVSVRRSSSPSSFVPLLTLADASNRRAQVEWPEINAAWGHTLLLLYTMARKFGHPNFDGYRLVPCGSFSCIERLGERGEVVQVLELCVVLSSSSPPFLSSSSSPRLSFPFLSTSDPL